MVLFALERHNASNDFHYDPIPAKADLACKVGKPDSILQVAKKEELGQCVKGLLRYKERIDLQKDKRDLLRIEAGAGQLYFRYYTSLFSPNYGFNSRNGGGIRTGNRYASDVINALLNYGYSVLAAEIAKFVYG
jgi:CRISP-associated protein Cas1